MYLPCRPNILLIFFTFFRFGNFWTDLCKYTKFLVPSWWIVKNLYYNSSFSAIFLRIWTFWKILWSLLCTIAFWEFGSQSILFGKIWIISLFLWHISIADSSFIMFYSLSKKELNQVMLKRSWLKCQSLLFSPCSHHDPFSSIRALGGILSLGGLKKFQELLPK